MLYVSTSSQHVRLFILSAPTVPGCVCVVLQPNLACPHRERCPIEHYGVAEWPAAQLRSSISDISRLLCALAHCATPSTHRSDTSPILSQASLKAMFPEEGLKGLAWWGQDATYSCHEPGECVLLSTTLFPRSKAHSTVFASQCRSVGTRGVHGRSAITRLVLSWQWERRRFLVQRHGAWLRRRNSGGEDPRNDLERGRRCPHPLHIITARDSHSKQ